MPEIKGVFKAADVLPKLVAVVSQNIIDGMRIWGEIEGDEIRLTRYALLAEEMARSTSWPDTVRVDVLSPVEGQTFLLFKRNQLVMVEAQP